MFGLILDFLWSSSDQDPVNVTVVASLDELRAVRRVNPTATADMWARVDVVPVESHNVTSNFGGPLSAHICARRGSEYLDALRVEEMGE